MDSQGRCSSENVPRQDPDEAHREKQKPCCSLNRDDWSGGCDMRGTFRIAAGAFAPFLSLGREEQRPLRGEICKSCISISSSPQISS